MKVLCLLALLGVVSAVPVHLRTVTAPHESVLSLMEEAARVHAQHQARVDNKMVSPMLDILKTKGTGGAFGHMTKALAVKVHRFELATAIVMLSDNMKLEKETISHQKENNVFPIELLSRLLVWAHDIWSVAANKAAIGAPDFASWVCHLFMLPGGFAHADATADQVKDLLTNGAPFKTGLYPGTAYFKGTEGNKKDQQTKSLALLKNLLNPSDPNTNHRTLYYMIQRLSEAGESVLKKNKKPMATSGIADLDWGKDKGCFRWTLIAVHEKKVAEPAKYVSGFSKAYLETMYKTLEACGWDEGNVVKKNVLAPACNDWMQKARPASTCPFQLIKAFKLISESNIDEAKKNKALDVLGAYLKNGDDGWFRYKPKFKAEDCAPGAKLRTDVLAAVDGTDMKATLENGIFKGDFAKAPDIAVSDIGTKLMPQIGDINMSPLEAETRKTGDIWKLPFWGVGGTAWYLPTAEWNLQWKGKALLSPALSNWLQQYIRGDGLLGAAGPSGTSAEMVTIGEYFGLTKSAFWQCKAFESLLGQMQFYNHHSYIEVQEALTRFGPGKKLAYGSVEEVIPEHKDRSPVIDMPKGKGGVDDPFAILKTCDKNLAPSTIMPVTVKWTAEGIPDGGAAAKAPAVPSTAVYPHVLKMFHKISNEGDSVYKALAADDNMPFRNHLDFVKADQTNLWKINEEGPGKAELETKICPDAKALKIDDTCWMDIFHCPPSQK